MKILFLTLARIDSIEVQGIYTDLLRKFRENGHEVTIVSPTERRYRKKTKYIEDGGVRILNVWTTNIQKTNLLEKGITTLFLEQYFYKAIKKYVNFKDVDMILYSTPPITLTNLIKRLKKISNAKTYLLLKDIFPQNAVDLNMISSDGILYNYFRKKEIELYNISDRIGCMSKENKKYILNHNPYLNEEKIEINPNSICLNEVKIQFNIKNSLLAKIPKNKIIFLYGGNLGKPQAIDFLLDVIINCKNISNAYFIIVGSGTETKKIFRWFDKYKPENSLFLNELNHIDYEALLSASHVGLVFLSPNFTIPNYPSRILSYMKNKLPILFATDLNTDVGKEAESYNYGFWCESGNLIQFIQFIKLLVSNEKLRLNMGINGYNRLQNDFDVNESYKKIINSFLT
jgi:glycosyltransferase involved in cell wall biosynthesis